MVQRYEDDILLLLLLSNDALLLPLAVSSEVISVHNIIERSHAVCYNNHFDYFIGEFIGVHAPSSIIVHAASPAGMDVDLNYQPSETFYKDYILDPTYVERITRK